NPATQENLQKLRQRGVHIAGPALGHLASGQVGPGRLLEPAELIGHIRTILGRTGDLAGKTIVVTAGGTQEPIDPVRVVTNLSSGKMGYALAAAAVGRGGRVILISGPVTIPAPIGLSQYVSVSTAAEMRDAVMSRLGEVEVVIKAAAVADFRPQKAARGKIKKDTTSLSLALERTPDILAEIGAVKEDRILVGFAAETDNLLENARRKIKEKNLDLLVVNDVGRPDIGFHSDYNQVTFVYADGTSEETPRLLKTEIAGIILDRVASLISRRRGRP
ncbi:MAG: bifunctional phosphopantothenoylcysteine decarboxylase/phosphopantothenate--cysteine ligase CoaBC, partial [Candidatus Tectomicrobia bacterium]|nr:bifunctional phosphopantothenoylcysteine decarboxylase/phosphopantothenate--cysteine ligase CoaBC [Candidatus Tectomicrobia bacterium]